MSRPRKITIAEVRSMGLGRLLVYCGDHQCLQQHRGRRGQMAG
jgi:hypothetical protein